MIFRQKWFGENITKNDGVFSAEVPGNIQYDYAKAKDWPDYQYSDNCKLFETIMKPYGFTVTELITFRRLL